MKYPPSEKPLVLHNVTGEAETDLHELAKALPPFPLPEGETLPKEGLTLPLWATKYLQSAVEGVQSPHTLQAKRRDLTAFMGWYGEMYGHLAIEQWLPRDTQGFLYALERKGNAPTSVNRALAVLRRFARWVHEQPSSPFRFGLPTQGIKELVTDEPTAKKLEPRDMNRLFKAADMMVLTDKRGNARPRRNRAILHLLYYAGLRVSELCALTLDQYQAPYLINVCRKGKSRNKRLYLATPCRAALDDYLEHERAPYSATWLLTPHGAAAERNRPITRQTVTHALNRIAELANAHSTDADKIHLHPHRLRHTFGAKVRESTGSDSETATLLGHTSTKYVGVYTRQTDEEREKVLEQLDPMAESQKR